MTSTAGEAIQRGIVDGIGHGTEFVDVLNYPCIVQNLIQVSIPNAKLENGSIAVHFRSDSRIGYHRNAEFVRQALDSPIVIQVLAHQYITYRDTDATCLEHADGCYRTPQ
jgi:hypothetical protein